MSPTDRPRELLALAERDFQAALILAHAENPQTDAAGFHLQHMAEKSLKVWLALDGVDYPRTHDLNPLLGLLEDQGENVEPFWSLLELDPNLSQPSGCNRVSHAISLTCLDRRLRRISIRLHPAYRDKSRICHNLRDFATKFVRHPGQPLCRAVSL